MLSSKQTAIESRFGLVVVLSAFCTKTREILTGSIQLHTAFLNGNRGDTYFRDNGLFAKKYQNIFLCVVNMCKFGYLRFLHTFPANMLKNCGLANINALLGKKGKNVTGKWDRAFFKLQITPGLFFGKV